MAEKEELRVHCNRCNATTYHVVESQLYETDPHVRTRESVAAYDLYQIIRCLGCRCLSFRNEFGLCITPCDDPRDEFADAILHPRRREGLLQIKPIVALPPIPTRIYRETIDAFNNELWTLCGGGVRATIESICRDRGIDKDKNLKEKIDQLHRLNIIGEEHAETLQELRFLGNDALHDLHLPDREELKTAISIVEKTLTMMYDWRNDKAKLREWRDKRQPQPQDPPQPDPA